MEYSLCFEPEMDGRDVRDVTNSTLRTSPHIHTHTHTHTHQLVGISLLLVTALVASSKSVCGRGIGMPLLCNNKLLAL